MILKVKILRLFFHVYGYTRVKLYARVDDNFRNNNDYIQVAVIVVRDFFLNNRYKRI